MRPRVEAGIWAGLMLALGIGVAWLLAVTLRTRYSRDVSRMVFNDNLQVLAELRRVTGVEADSLARVVENRDPPAAPYVVVSIEDHRLWYRSGDSVLFTAAVATGSGKVLERVGTDTHWRFETPRGRLFVEARDSAPVWVAPDWYYVEEAQRLGLGVVKLARGQRIPDGRGGWIVVRGSDVVRLDSDGNATVFGVGEGNDVIVGGNLVIPPFGTNQRKFPGVMGTRRLNLGNGYSIHGTNRPETIGRSVSHGCVRLRNEDIEQLWNMVPVGTAVYIY